MAIHCKVGSFTAASQSGVEVVNAGTLVTKQLLHYFLLLTSRALIFLLCGFRITHADKYAKGYNKE